MNLYKVPMSQEVFLHFDKDNVYTLSGALAAQKAIVLHFNTQLLGKNK